jgi:hypothetical protein
LETIQRVASLIKVTLNLCQIIDVIAISALNAEAFISKIK